MDDLNRDALNTPRTDDLRRNDVNTGEEIGEAVGGISGVLTGAALGSLGGPIGTIIGGIAGAVSGWWAGKAISEAASHVTTEDEDYYRTHYDASTSRLADRSFDDVRPAYQIGHLAARNPDYSSRQFDEVEPDLRSGWTQDVSNRHGSWDQVRDYARHGFDRSRTGFGTGAVAGAADSTASNLTAGTPLGGGFSGSDSGTALGTSGALGDRAEGAWDRTKAESADLGHRAANTLDDMKDRVDGNPASRPGPDSTDRPGYGASGAGTVAGPQGDRLEDTWDRTKNAAERLGHRAADAVDNVKDRIDGNPDSRPGPDATDRRF
jgi:hypothetical protein